VQPRVHVLDGLHHLARLALGLVGVAERNPLRLAANSATKLACLVRLYSI